MGVWEFGIATIATLGLVGGTLYKFYWRDSETMDDWSQREELLTMMIHAADHLMIGCHLREQEREKSAVDSADSVLYIQVSTAKLLAAFNAASRCRFSRTIREKLTKSSSRFTFIFAKLSIHPHAQHLIAEKAVGKSSIDLLNELLEKIEPINSLAPLALAFKEIGSIKEECISLLKVLDPKKLRWISVEDWDRYSKAEGNTDGQS